MSNKRTLRLTLILAVLLFISSLYHLPYYVSKPGMAKELAPIIKVEGGHEIEGSLMLTTIRMGRANIYSYLMAQFSDYQHIYTLEEIRGENETDADYTSRQLHMMDHSKMNAIEVAYKKAGLPIEYKYKGIFVLQVIPDMPAEGKLEVGNRIVEIDGNNFNSSTEFINYVSSKDAGETITLTVDKNGHTEKLELALQEFSDNSGRAGIGISLIDDKELVVDPKVEVKTDEIGGPSAGLMFSLEIYNQLIKEDLTKGYHIAGTGTISPDGNVGRIGGIEQKIVAADKAGADFFLAPSEEGGQDSNYEVAVQTAADINTTMKIIPVDHFDDAIFFFENLKQKQAD
ncbi:SepM family pheromone-processing serine protease [Bacillus sp. B15-48]|uniref:SepM family pheromone-processing serine protease n=1 Tax=Bacillus sp. B15-48 TaxID=1548601 RepID=UPI00193F0CEB|nr:SepM family pheromone-processing serine protease [Bacillus sp. B15-48]MBM4764047.1 PDZ domain-containing protein [Bacillus sp. B15-48]